MAQVIAAEALPDGECDEWMLMAPEGAAHAASSHPLERRDPTLWCLETFIRLVKASLRVCVSGLPSARLRQTVQGPSLQRSVRPPAVRGAQSGRG